MSKLSGVVLILAGLGVGAYALPSRHDTAPEAVPPQQGKVKANSAALSLSKGADGAGPSGPLVVRQAHHEAALASAQTAVMPSPTPAVQPSRPATPAKVMSPPAARVAEATPRVPVGQYTPAAGPPLDRAGLTRELQRQLKRVGCYGGDINGVWTPSARRSMKAFTDRVNATLPIEQPDYILLAMVQNHPDQACGRSCPPGQGLAEDGRCLPNALMTRAAKTHAPAPHAASLAAKTSPPAHNSPTAVPAPSSADRMALAGPPAANDPARIAPANPLPAEAEAAAQQAQAAKSARQPGRPDGRERRRLRAWGQGGTAANRFPAWAVPHAMP